MAANSTLAALKAARQFIVNGVELGFIRMPDAETPDPAHDTLPMIERAIAEREARTDEANGEGFRVGQFQAATAAMQPMETAPRDGTHILIKHVVTHYTDGNGRYRFKDYRPVGHKWAEFRFVDGEFRLWTGTDETNQIGGGGEPIGWAPIPGEQAPTPRAVDLPAFDGYQAHIVRELQAAFVQACEKAGIKVDTL